MVSKRPNYLEVAGEKPPSLKKEGPSETQPRKVVKEDSIPLIKKGEEASKGLPLKHSDPTLVPTRVGQNVKNADPDSKSTSELDTTLASERRPSFTESQISMNESRVEEQQPSRPYSAKENPDVKETVIDSLDCKILCVRVDPDDKYIAAACEDGRIRIYLADSGEKYSEIKFSDNVENVEMCVRWRPYANSELTHNVIAACDTVGNIYHVHVTSNRILHTIEQKDTEIYSLDYSYDASKFATGGIDKKVTVYDEHKKTISNVLTAGHNNPVHNNRVLAVKFSQDDPNLLVSGGWDNTVIMWDLRAKHSVGYIFGPQIYGEALDCQGDMLLTGSAREEKQIQMWDLRTRKSLLSLDWDSNPEVSQKAYIYSAQFGKKNKSLVGMGSTGLNEVRIFDHEDGFALKQKIEKGENAIYSLDFFHSSNNYVYSGSHGTLAIVRAI